MPESILYCFARAIFRKMAKSDGGIRIWRKANLPWVVTGLGGLVLGFQLMIEREVFHSQIEVERFK